jgi:hypothetical protein
VRGPLVQLGPEVMALVGAAVDEVLALLRR